MTAPTFLFIVSGVLLNAVAQLLLKAGVAPLGPIGFGSGDLLPTLMRAVGQWPIIAGLACYAVSVVVWIIGLSRVEVSVAYPMLSLGYIVNAVLAWWLFGEALGPQRWAGLLLILCGVWLVARS